MAAADHLTPLQRQRHQGVRNLTRPLASESLNVSATHAESQESARWRLPP